MIMNKYTKLIFEENFKQKSLNIENWNYVHAGTGFGNKEWQFYRQDSDNVKIVDNKLIITAKKEDYEHCHYTSGKIHTKGKFSFQYGRVDVVAKLPFGQGFWPAIWMMPEESNYGYWPSCGEIDIMESLGHDPEYIYGTIHYGDPHKYHGPQARIKNANEFHKYSIIWEKEKITWLIDDVIIGDTSKWFSYQKKIDKKNSYPAPFNQKFYLILNFAIGGNFSGYPDDTTSFPAEFIIESVKVYQ